MKKLLRRIALKLNLWAKPDNDELVSFLVLHTASLELYSDQYIELAPVKGTCGPIKLSGNSLPVFEYIVFEKAIMEFIKVRVELARPDKIRFLCTIDSVTAPERHGEEVELKDKYRAPFDKLAWHLMQYFPFYKKRDV